MQRRWITHISLQGPSYTVMLGQVNAFVAVKCVFWHLRLKTKTRYMQNSLHFRFFSSWDFICVFLFANQKCFSSDVISFNRIKWQRHENTASRHISGNAITFYKRIYPAFTAFENITTMLYGDNSFSQNVEPRKQNTVNPINGREMLLHDLLVPRWVRSSMTLAMFCGQKLRYSSDNAPVLRYRHAGTISFICKPAFAIKQWVVTCNLSELTDFKQNIRYPKWVSESYM